MRNRNVFTAVFLVGALTASAWANGKGKLTLDLYLDWEYVAAPQISIKKLPWEDPSEHLRRSPITYVGNVTTPTMLMTGEIDLRTPIEETEQYYRALKLRKIDTVMVRIADEYHGFNATPRHPSNRLQQILYLRGWFEKYRKR